MNLIFESVCPDLDIRSHVLFRTFLVSWLAKQYFETDWDGGQVDETNFICNHFNSVLIQHKIQRINPCRTRSETMSEWHAELNGLKLMARYTNHITQRPCPLRTEQATYSGLSIQSSLDGNNFSYSRSYSEDTLVLFASNGHQFKPPQVSATNWIPPWKMKCRAVEGGSHQAKLKNTAQCLSLARPLLIFELRISITQIA